MKGQEIARRLPRALSSQRAGVYASGLSLARAWRGWKGGWADCPSGCTVVVDAALRVRVDPRRCALRGDMHVPLSTKGLRQSEHTTHNTPIPRAYSHPTKNLTASTRLQVAKNEKHSLPAVFPPSYTPGRRQNENC